MTVPAPSIYTYLWAFLEQNSAESKFDAACQNISCRFGGAHLYVPAAWQRGSPIYQRLVACLDGIHPGAAVVLESFSGMRMYVPVRHASGRIGSLDSSGEENR